MHNRYYRKEVDWVEMEREMVGEGASQRKGREQEKESEVKGRGPFYPQTPVGGGK